MGYDRLHGLGPGDISEQGVPSSHRKTDAAALQQKLVVSPLGGGDGGGNVGGGFGGDGGVRIEEE